MKKQLFLLSSLGLLLGGCETRTNAPTQNVDTNTVREAVERGIQTLTPGSPAEEADRMLTQRIHQALMEDNTLSPNARNVQIRIMNGMVTLRGAASNEAERNEIARKVRSIVGVRNVDNQIEIIRNGSVSDRR
jgi:hyperosmotically inducible periplasmic protein